jgi:hypothetical protein
MCVSPSQLRAVSHQVLCMCESKSTSSSVASFIWGWINTYLYPQTTAFFESLPKRPKKLVIRHIRANTGCQANVHVKDNRTFFHACFQIECAQSM